MADYKQIQWTPENVAKFWDYTSHFPELYFTYRCGDMVVKKNRKYLKKGCSVLDYGCGTGFLIPHLLAAGVKVTGLDFSSESIKSVNDRFGKEEDFKGAFLREDILLKSLKFDAIFLLEVIEHLDDKYLNETFEDLKNLLKDGGVVIITTPNNEKLEDNYIFCPRCKHIFHRWQHVRKWDKEQLRNYVEKKGFKIVEIVTADFVASFKKDKIALVKHLIKKLLGYKSPKLLCVCRL